LFLLGDWRRQQGRKGQKPKLKSAEGGEEEGEMGEKSQGAGWCVLQESLRLLLGVKVVDQGSRTVSAFKLIGRG
jgi:hypothetical protein